MKRRPATFDSLDLLLDTICNTFGGVLFIAMLVIILLNLSGKQAATVAPDESARKELTDAQRNLSVAQSELDRLRRASQEQSALAKLLSNPEVKSLYAWAVSQQATLASSSESRSKNLEEASRIQSQANELADSLKALDDALAAAEQRLEVVAKQLQSERQLRTRTVNLPKQRATSKQQIAYLLRGGRLYGYMRIGSGGQRERDQRDTQVTTEGGVTYLLPNPGGGTSVEAKDPTGAIAQKLANWDPKQFFIAVAVWPDSFEHFSTVRQILVERNLEYQLIPLPEQEKVLLTDDASDNLVQ